VVVAVVDLHDADIRLVDYTPRGLRVVLIVAETIALPATAEECQG
jgi:hypothetical protein